MFKLLTSKVHCECHKGFGANNSKHCVLRVSFLFPLPSILLTCSRSRIVDFFPPLHAKTGIRETLRAQLTHTQPKNVFGYGVLVKETINYTQFQLKQAITSSANRIGTQYQRMRFVCLSCYCFSPFSSQACYIHVVEQIKPYIRSIGAEHFFNASYRCKPNKTRESTKIKQG